MSSIPVPVLHFPQHLAALKAARIVGSGIRRAKVVLSGKLDRAVVLKGVAATKGARAAIEAAGGKVEE